MYILQAHKQAKEIESGLAQIPEIYDFIKTAEKAGEFPQGPMYDSLFNDIKDLERYF